MRDNGSHLLVFMGGFLLGALLTGGVFGTYLVLGGASHRAMMEARLEAELAQREAMMARMVAEEQAARARAEQAQAEARLRQAEDAKNNPKVIEP